MILISLTTNILLFIHLSELRTLILSRKDARDRSKVCVLWCMILNTTNYVRILTFTKHWTVLFIVIWLCFSEKWSKIVLQWLKINFSEKYSHNSLSNFKFYIFKHIYKCTNRYSYMYSDSNQAQFQLSLSIQCKCSIKHFAWLSI